MENTDSDSLSQDHCFENYPDGSVHELGSVTVDQDEMIAFARRYDPQIFHTDPAAAKKTIYGGLIASGWLTAALTMRVIAEGYLSKATCLGSPGLEEIRFPQPVRPGDVLSVRVTVVQTSRSRSKPHWGILRSLVEVLNQNREIVMTMKATNFILCAS
jgi:acyl dehydratase